MGSSESMLGVSLGRLEAQGCGGWSVPVWILTAARRTLFQVGGLRAQLQQTKAMAEDYMRQLEDVSRAK